MLSPPYLDTVRKDGLVADKAAFYWLKVAVKRSGVLVSIHASTWVMPDVAVVKDPAGIVATNLFATNLRDPEGIKLADGTVVADTYDETHPEYRGVPGLFSNAQGNIALKIKVPAGATEDYLSSVAWHSVTWKAKIDNGSGGTITIGPTSETFKVAPAGTFVFEDQIITAAEVLEGIATEMSGEQVQTYVTRANNWFIGKVKSRGCGAGIVYDELWRDAVVNRARRSIFQKDMFAGIVKSVREGPDQITFSGREGTERMFEADADSALKDYMRLHCGLGKPFVSRVGKAYQLASPPFTYTELVVPTM